MQKYTHDKLGCVNSLRMGEVSSYVYSDICPCVWYSSIFLVRKSWDVAVGLITSHRAFCLHHFTRIMDNSIVSGQRGDTPDFFRIWLDVSEVNGGVMEGFSTIQCVIFSRWQHENIAINILILALLLNSLEDECIWNLGWIAVVYSAFKIKISSWSNAQVLSTTFMIILWCFLLFWSSAAPVLAHLHYI